MSPGLRLVRVAPGQAQRAYPSTDLITTDSDALPAGDPEPGEAYVRSGRRFGPSPTREAWSELVNRAQQVPAEVVKDNVDAPIAAQPRRVR